MPWRETLCTHLPPKIAAYLAALSSEEARQVAEIRAYVGRGVEISCGQKRMHTGIRLDRAGMDRLLAALSGYALYSVERQMAQGYIPLPGGHRAGVCGTMTCRTEGDWRMAEVSSVCIRIARHIPGASLGIRSRLLGEGGAVRSLLLIGPPGCGKTTVLRDAALFLAEKGISVAVADEREELFPGLREGCCVGIDVLSGMDKADAFPLLLRAMSPQALIADEIGSGRDAQAVSDAARCGVGVIASAHAEGMDDLLARPFMAALVHSGAFPYIVRLGRMGKVVQIWDGCSLKTAEQEVGDGKLGCGGHGDDRVLHDRISSF